MKVTKKDFGSGATLYTLENDNNVRLSATDLGARIVNWMIPVQGETNIVLGFERAEDYQTIDTYLGATIGRVAGRISNGTFSIDDVPYHVTTQADQHHHTLHGGPHSFESKIWATKVVENTDNLQLIFSYHSPDGENKFPGNMEIQVAFTLNNQNEWHIDYQATTDQATLFNPTNHVYFNLQKDHLLTMHEHTLELASQTFAVVNPDVTATGEKRAVKGAPFDFTTPQKLASIYNATYEQNALVGGLDHPFFLDKAATQARLTSPDGKINIEMSTDEEAVVIFSGNFGPENPGESKVKNFTGITLETQASPGAIEFEGFGNIILRPEETYTSSTIFKVNF